MPERSLCIWQLQDYDLDHIRRVIGLAAESGVNRIQLSHSIVMKAEAVLSAPTLARDINTISEWAHAKKVKVDVWTHELSGVPGEFMTDGRAELDSPDLWKHVREKYNGLFSVCPRIDGLVLTMHETAVKIFQDASVATTMSPEERVTRLVDELGAVCKSYGKELFVRTFSYEPDELRRVQNGLKACSSDIIAMTKCVPHDWQPYYPANPVIGDVGGKRQVVEFDLGHEFTGLSRIPYVMIDYFKRHWDYDLSKGTCGAVLRLERHAWRALDTPNWANVEICTKLLKNPKLDPQVLYRKWLAARYGKDAAESLYSAFGRTRQIVDLGYFVLGFWVTNHSLLPSYEYAAKSLRNRTSAKWDPSTQSIEQELLNPTWDTVRRISREKDEALALVEKSLADIETARPHLGENDYAELKDLFEREKAMVIVWKAAIEVIFGVTICRASSQAHDLCRLSKAADRLEQVAAENRKHLVNMSVDSRGSHANTNVGVANELVLLARSTTRQA